jgi:hypothetical protein
MKSAELALQPTPVQLKVERKLNASTDSPPPHSTRGLDSAIVSIQVLACEGCKIRSGRLDESKTKLQRANLQRSRHSTEEALVHL